MSVKKRTIALVAMLLALALVRPSLAAWRSNQPQRFDRQKAQEHIMDKLELTEEQKAKFKEHLAEMKKTTDSHWEQIRELGEKMKVEMAKDQPDRAVIHDIIKRMSDLNTDMQIKRADSLLDLRESLTPEQRAKFKKLLEGQPPRPGQRPKPLSDGISDCIMDS
ncbi:MAG: periplasmic heavy metal sensor [Candidatus Saganbacteria bacterium]|nr:periplasmic heavy metal sensor [Candidatus Saganbacteria bacterium]